MFDADSLELAIEDLAETEDEDFDAGWEDPWWNLIETLDGAGKTYDVKVGDDTVAVGMVEYSTGTYDDDTYVILTAGGKTFRKFGWTASHDGTYWEGSFNEVRPVEKTITVWENL